MQFRVLKPATLVPGKTLVVVSLVLVYALLATHLKAGHMSVNIIMYVVLILGTPFRTTTTNLDTKAATLVLACYSPCSSQPWHMCYREFPATKQPATMVLKHWDCNLDSATSGDIGHSHPDLLNITLEKSLTPHPLSIIDELPICLPLWDLLCKQVISWLDLLVCLHQANKQQQRDTGSLLHGLGSL